MAMNASDIAAATGNPNVRKYLDMLAQSEGVKYGYATGFGNRPLETLEDHPRTQAKFTQTDGKQNSTSAAGRYQFLQNTWDSLKKKYAENMPDFGADSQDFAATALLAQNGALSDILKGDFKSAINKSGTTWASLPSSPYKQNKRSWDDISGYLGETVAGGGGGAPVADQPVKQNMADNLNVFKAYQSGAMSDPQQRADFENDVHSGAFQLPKNVIVKVGKPAQDVPIAAVQAFNDGKMTAQQSADFLRDIDAGKIKIPKGANLLRENAPQAQPDTLTGDLGQGISKLASSAWNGGNVLTGIPKAVYGAGEAVVGGALGMGKEAAKGIYGTASGLAGMLPTAIGGGGGFEQGYQQGAQAVENLIPNVQMATNAGQAIQQIMGAPSAEFTRGGQAAGQAVENLTGSTQLGALAGSGFETLGNALAMGAPLKGRVAPEIAAAERTRQQITANPPEQFAAQPIQAAERPVVAPQEAITPRPAQPLAPTSEGLATQAETMQRPAETPVAATAEQAATVAPSVAEVAPTATVEVGKPAIWRNADTDTPVVVKNIEQQAGSDGKTYARVEINGKDSFIPANELVATIDSTKPVEPLTNVESLNAPKVPELPLQELASKARTATESPIGRNAAQQILAEQASPNAPVVAAATRLGIIDQLQPDHVTTNQSFRELSQAIKSYPASPLRAAELQGLEAVAARADKIIGDLGANKDVSSLSQKVKDEMRSSIEELQAHAKTMYDGLRERIPQKSVVSAKSTLEFIQKRADDLGGVEYLSPLEKSVMARLNDKTNPTYARLDDVRRDLTAAKYKNQGAFKDADAALITKIESELQKDQRTALETVAKKEGLDQKGLIADFDLAQKTASTYKSMQEEAVNLFGKQLDGNIARSLKNAINGLPIGDTKALVNILNSVPENMRGEVIANGLAYAFERNAGAINHNTFANFWNGIKRNQEALKILKANLPTESFNALNDLGIVSESIAKASKERIVTGRLNVVTEALKEADTWVGKLYEQAKSGAVKAMGAEAISSSLGVPGMGIALGATMALLKDKPPIHLAVDKLLGSKEFQDAVAAKSKLEGKGNANK